jgi:hypothetical protein
MAKTQYYTATSIDWFIADPEPSLEWLFQVPADDDEGHEDRFTRFFGEVGAMAIGSSTYEWVLEHEQLLEHPEKWHAFYGTTPCRCSPAESSRRSPRQISASFGATSRPSTESWS